MMADGINLPMHFARMLQRQYVMYTEGNIQKYSRLDAQVAQDKVRDQFVATVGVMQPIHLRYQLTAQYCTARLR